MKKTDSTAKTIGEYIKHLRLTAGISQMALCNDIGISNTAYHKIETGTSYPSISTLLRLAIYYDTPISCFVDNHSALISSPCFEEGAEHEEADFF